MLQAAFRFAVIVNINKVKAHYRNYKQFGVLRHAFDLLARTEES